MGDPARHPRHRGASDLGGWVFLGGLLARLFESIPPSRQLPSLYAGQVPTLFAAGVLFYLLSAGLHYVLISFEAVRDREKKEAALALLAREAELHALKSAHPAALPLQQLERRQRVDRPRRRARPGDVRRAGGVPAQEPGRGGAPLDPRRGGAGPGPALPGRRADPVRARLSVEEDVDATGEECLVPPLLLQPLVENAVVHGIATLVDGGTVRLETRRAGHRLRIVIENPFDPEAPARPRNGLGLRIVRERLNALYGADAIFAARKVDGRHLAIISIPARA